MFGTVSSGKVVQLVMFTFETRELGAGWWVAYKTDRLIWFAAKEIELINPKHGG